MITGILFLIMGVYVFIKEFLNMEMIGEERVVTVKKDIKKDSNFKFRLILGIFSLVLGIFRILNIIIF